MSNSGSLTPNDLRNQVFERKVRGCDPVEVATVLEEAAAQWERILAENLHLSERCATLEEQIKKYAGLEQTLRDTLVMARKAAEDETENAKKEAKLIVERARLEADGIVREAHTRADGYRRQLEQLRNARDRLKADMEGLLHSYTEQIKKLDATVVVEIETPAVAERSGMVAPQREKKVSAPELPGKSMVPVVEDTTGAPVQEPFIPAEQQERADTQDAFDAALNKIFGGEADETTPDKPGTKGGPSSGSGN